MSLSFPPFTRAIKTLLAINIGMYMLMILLAKTGAVDAGAWIVLHLGLIPQQVVHGWVWQLLTYSTIHGGFFHLFFNMLMLWMFGANLEIQWGHRRFMEFFFFGVFGAGLTSVLLAYTLGHFVSLDPTTVTVGASGGVFAIYMACAMLFGEQQVFIFPLPLSMKMKYLVFIFGFIALIGALDDRAGGGTANIAHLGGLLFGYLYVKFVPRRGFSYVLSEGYFGVRNSYHRWKRRRAGRKFQVYMRKHNKDPKEYFDEYGNFRPPEDLDKKDGGPGGWVN
jgi:membrane associated rhomboid family serine protease